MYIFMGGELPSMAGSKFNIWQSGQIIKGDPGRGYLELPFLALHLNILVLPSVGWGEKKFMCIVLVWYSVICFVWVFALF